MGRLNAGAETGPQHFILEPEPQEETATEIYETLPEVNEVVETALETPETQTQGIVERFADHLADIKKNLAEGHIDKSLARIEIDTLIAEIKTLRDEWLGKKSPEAVQKLEGILAEFKVFRKDVATRMEKFRRFMTGPLLGLGVLGAAKAGQAYQEFGETTAAVQELAKEAGEFTPPPVPESFLVMSEHAELPNTDDLFAKYEAYNERHREANLDTIVSEPATGALGMYLKFNSLKLLSGDKAELAKRAGVSEPELDRIKQIFHKSIYEQVVNARNTFYVCEQDFRPSRHPEFYAEELGAALELVKRMLPQINEAPEAIKPELESALEEFLNAEFFVRMYDERIKDAIANQREFELEGTEGKYNDDVPSLFTRQNFHIEKRTKAMDAWYGAMKKVHPEAGEEENLAKLLTNLQGWADKRAVAIEVATSEAKDGLLKGGAPDKWKQYVEKGDADYRASAQAFETLLANFQPHTETIAAK